MGRDFEKDMRELRDSVNSGVIDDKLSDLVGEVRMKATAGRQALADDEVEMIAAAGDPGYRGNTAEDYLNWYKSIWEQVKGELENAVNRHQDLANKPNVEICDNDTIEVQEFI